MISKETIYAEALYLAALQAEPEAVTREFISLLEERDAIKLLPGIVAAFDKQCGEPELRLTFPFEQSQTLIENLRRSLPGYGFTERVTTAQVSLRVDKTLIGGFIAEAEGKILDASVKRVLGRA